MDKYGFVYIWYDRKRKMYYIGSHWGTEDDGYICSSNRMRKAYKRRPQDFKRRILSRNISTRKELFEKEQQWFDRVKRKDRYYNLRWDIPNGDWRDDQEKFASFKNKISNSLSGRTQSEETKKKRAESIRGQKRSEETKKKMSAAQKGKIIPEHQKEILRNIHSGKKHTAEARHNMSIAQQKRTSYPTVSDETKKKISESLKGNVPWNKGKSLSTETKSKISLSKMGQKHSEETKRKMSISSKKKSYKFRSPDGVEVITNNLVQFCIEHQLNAHSMRKLANGKYPREFYRGWSRL